MKPFAAILCAFLLDACTVTRPSTTCAISHADRTLMSSLLSMRWENTNADMVRSMWPRRLSDYDGSSHSECSVTLLLGSPGHDGGACADTVVFDRVATDAGHCTQRLAAVTLLRTIAMTTTPQSLYAELEDIMSGVGDSESAISPHGFTRVVNIDRFTTYTVRVDIEPYQNRRRARILIYRTVLPP